MTGRSFRPELSTHYISHWPHTTVRLKSEFLSRTSPILHTPESHATSAPYWTEQMHKLLYPL